jgi:hypothetical protein
MRGQRRALETSSVYSLGSASRKRWIKSLRYSISASSTGPLFIASGAIAAPRSFESEANRPVGGGGRLDAAGEFDALPAVGRATGPGRAAFSPREPSGSLMEGS